MTGRLSTDQSRSRIYTQATPECTEVRSAMAGKEVWCGTSSGFYLTDKGKGKDGHMCKWLCEYQ